MGRPFGYVPEDEVVVIVAGTVGPDAVFGVSDADRVADAALRHLSRDEQDAVIEDIIRLRDRPEQEEQTDD